MTPWTTTLWPDLPVHHQLPELAQTHVHWVSDAIQPSHPLSPPSPLGLNLSQPHVFSMSWLFTSGGQSIGASALPWVLPMNIQGWFSFWIDWVDLLVEIHLRGPQAESGQGQAHVSGLNSAAVTLELSRVVSITTVWKHQFFGTQPSLWPNYHIHTWLLRKTWWCFCFLIHWVCHNFSSKERASFNFMAAVTIHSDFGAQENSVSLLPFLPSTCHEVMGLDAITFVFLNIEF